MTFHTKKSLGQNFLSNLHILEKISEAAELSSNDRVLEVGPGRGTLTEVLRKKSGAVIAVEKDHRLIEELKEKFKNRANTEILEGDILEFDPAVHGLEEHRYKIVANIPYYITSHFIRIALESWPQPELIVLTVQKEVAQRIVATAPDMNLLALSVQFYADAEIVGTIKAGSFHPVPGVDSAIIKLTPKEPPLSRSEASSFFAFLKQGFSSKRKQLVNNLTPRYGSRQEVLEAMKSVYSNEQARPENLSLQEWIQLYNALGKS